MYWIVYFISFLFSIIPVSLFNPIAKCMRFFFFDVLRLRRKLILSNLDHAFKNEKTRAEKLKIARACFESFMLSLLESLRGSHKNMAEHITIHGKENIDRALTKNKGAIILCLHMGNWEAIAAGTGTYVTPVHAPVKKVGSAGVNKFVVETRARYRVTCLIRKKKGDAYLGIVKALEQNFVIGFMLDQSRPGEPKLPFFGIPAKTNTSLAAIWNKLQVPIVPGYTIRRAPNQHEIFYLPELTLQNGPDKESEIIQNTLTFSSVLEGFIRKHPEQYFWFHDRWKE